MSDPTSPIASIPIVAFIFSCIIINNHLYLGGIKALHVFEVSNSLTEPLKPARVIATSEAVFKILRVSNELLLG